MSSPQERAVATLAELRATGGVHVALFVERRAADERFLRDGRPPTDGSGQERWTDVGVGVAVTGPHGRGSVAVGLPADESAGPLGRALDAAAERAGAGVPRGLAAALDAAMAPWRAAAHPPPDEPWVTDLLHAADRGARAAGPDVAAVAVSWSAQHRDVLLLDPDRAHVGSVETRYLLTCRAVAQSARGQAVGYRRRGVRDVRPWSDSPAAAAAAGTGAGTSAVERTGAPQVQEEGVTVVIGAGFSGVLAHELVGHPLEADVAGTGTAGVRWRVGDQIGGPELRVVDDPGLPGGWGSHLYDDEGTPATPRELVREGNVVALLGPAGRARRASFAKPPLVRMSNLWLAAGGAKPADMIGDVAHGYHLAALGGGTVAANGTFAIGAVDVRRIERGRLGAPVADGVLTGHVATALHAVRGVGDDPRAGAPASCVKYGQELPVGDGGPTLLLTDVTLEVAR